MIFIATLIAVLHVASSVTLNTTRVFKYHTFSLPPTPNIPDTQFLVKELSSFVHHHGRNATSTQARPPSRPNGTTNGTALRIWPWYYDPDDKELIIKIVDMMKQAIYDTQDRLKYLDKILSRYTDDMNFRIGFIYSKLDQLLTDMKRIYTIVIKDGFEKRNYRQIMTYAHMAKKNIDVTYIVEYLAATYHSNMDLLFGST